MPRGLKVLILKSSEGTALWRHLTAKGAGRVTGFPRGPPAFLQDPEKLASSRFSRSEMRSVRLGEKVWWSHYSGFPLCAACV